MGNIKEVRIGDLKKFKIVRYVWTPEREKLKRDIIEKGFDNLNHSLVLTNDFYVLDGNHRLKIMENNFNDDYKVNVEIKNTSIRTLSLFIVLSTILFLPIVITHLLMLEYKIRKNKIPYEFEKSVSRNT